MLHATIVPVTAFAQNCSVIWCDRTGAGAVIDPGGDIDQILEAVRESGMRPEKILLTHAHIDHAGATAELARSLKLPTWAQYKFWRDKIAEDRKAAVTAPDSDVLRSFFLRTLNLARGHYHATV